MHKGGSLDLRGTSTERAKRRRVMLAAEPLCRHCARLGRVTVAVDLDHIVPLAAGGSDAMDNIQPLCRACHVKKTRQDMGYRPRHEIGIDGWPLDA